MCGIVGYAGQSEVVANAIKGLKRLEYRGYDSAGVAFVDNSKLFTVKKQGKITNLETKLAGIKIPHSAKVAIAHTRWATHGKPSDINAHPHLSCDKSIAIAHNGIIENYQVLKQKLSAKGHKFKSTTDTEVIVHLLEAELSQKNDLNLETYLHAVASMVSKLSGQYAIGIISKHFPDVIIGVRHKAPLVIGIGEECCILASDVTAILPVTKKILAVNDDEVVIIKERKYNIYSVDDLLNKKELCPIRRRPVLSTLSAENTEKGEFEHFMLKEIYEQPETLKNTILANSQGQNLKFDIPNNLKFDQIIFTGCGTAYYSALSAKYYFQEKFQVPMSIEVASELRYSNCKIDKRTLVISVSQSGETADTLEALRLAKRNKAKTIVITNWIGSTMAREADFVVNINCGIEIGVAATKTFVSQITALLMLADYLSGENNLKELRKLSDAAKSILKDAPIFMDLAKKCKDVKDIIYIGRGSNLAIALEGALKCKEISYVHAEGFPSGELKHGAIALLEKNVPLIAVIGEDRWKDKVISNIEESLARKSPVIIISADNNKEILKLSENVYFLPKIAPMLQPILATIPLQLFAYYLALELGCEIDKPRNLAKSVTVE